MCLLSARVILGVTNPFFVKALDHWPHILKVSTIFLIYTSSFFLSYKYSTLFINPSL